MARLRDYIGLLIFSILCVSALFMQSHSFTDSYIVPKWLITLFVFGGFVLYCTIAIWFTNSIKVNMFLVLFLCHWSLIGLSKTYFFQIPEDFLLASATIPGLYLFFREYFLNNLHADTKPKAKYINWLLISVCVGLAVLLTTTMFLELVPKG